MQIEHISVDKFNEKYPTYFKKKHTNKFNAKRLLLDGKNFDSISEGQYYSELKLQKKAGLIKEIYCQWKEELYAYGVHICNYYLDFKVIHNDEKIELIEHKGLPTAIWQLKWKMLKAKYKEDKNVILSINWYKSKYKFK